MVVINIERPRFYFGDTFANLLNLPVGQIALFNLPGRDANLCSGHTVTQFGSSTSPVRKRASVFHRLLPHVGRSPVRGLFLPIDGRPAIM